VDQGKHVTPRKRVSAPVAPTKKKRPSPRAK
jgi:hypothetical protein